MAIGTTAALLLAGSAAASAGSSIYASNKQSQAAKDAAKASGASSSEAIALERENEARRREEWDQTQAWNEQSYNDYMTRDDARYAEGQARTAKLDAFEREQYDKEMARRDPYRKVSVSALNQLAGLAGLPAGVTFQSGTISGSAKAAK